MMNSSVTGAGYLSARLLAQMTLLELMLNFTYYFLRKDSIVFWTEILLIFAFLNSARGLGALVQEFKRYIISTA